MKRVAALAVLGLLATSASPQTVAPPLERSAQWIGSDGAYRLHMLSGPARDIVRPDAEARKSADSKVQNSALSQALSRAWKVDFIEDGIEGSKEMLRQCQRETSIVLTTPFMRSDAQQAHCSRF